MPLWLGMQIEQDIRNLLAAEGISQRSPERKDKSMANTGARGFAAIMKARMAEMNDAFSKLADEVNGEFDQMKGHLETGRESVKQLKADNVELREAFGLENEPKP